MRKLINNRKGATFIELLLYVAIFLVLTPILLSVAVNSLKTSRSYTLEKQVNVDGQFNTERIYALISNAKKVDVANSTLNDSLGKLALIDQDDQDIVIELNPLNNKIEITEDGIVSSLTSTGNKVSQLYFEKIPDNVNDPEVAIGINVRIKMAGEQTDSAEQRYVLSGNLKRGDYDNDGCLDHMDLFPRHAECCGDGDGDGMCDELDNCVLKYNPFQEDYDIDEVGDICDVSAFLGGGNSGNTNKLGAFSCSPDDELMELIYADPPTNTAVLKSVLLSSSPLSSTVLWALEDTHPLMAPGHFLQVILNNMALPQSIYDAVIELDITPGHRNQFEDAQIENPEIPSVYYYNPITHYQQIEFFSDAVEPETWTNRIQFSDPDYPLCHEGFLNRTDIIVMDVENGYDSITVTTNTAGGSDTTYLTTSNNLIVDSNGFAIEFNEKVGNGYAILITSDSCSDDLNSFEIDFGAGANIIAPPTTDTDYEAVRYTSYCSGGCTTNCGDVGTGITFSSLLTDKCYKADASYPEWCSIWHTFIENDTANPAFVGGTQEGEETVYWEKTFKTVINELQLQNLSSITVTGEIAYQNITNFFCDTLLSSCPMEASLVGTQDVELYNFATSNWVSIGTMGTNGNTSNQQAFEIVYSNADVSDFIGGTGNEQIKARVKFNWDGNPPGVGSSAPSFMLIDYFTTHLKW